MKCIEIQNRLPEWIDESLSDDVAASIESHLESCSECQNLHQQLLTVHNELLTLGNADQQTAQRIAQAVLSDPITGPSTHASHLTPSRKFWWMGTVLGCVMSAAAGFLAAVVWLQPSAETDSIVESPVNSDVEILLPVTNGEVEEHLESITPPIHLVHATGNVSFKTADNDTWKSIPVAEIPTFACPSSGSLRTEPGVLCELKTAKGGIVRLNESCEVKVHSEEELELVRGEVWCRASEDSPIKVTAPQANNEPQSTSELMTFLCPSNSEGMACVSTEQPLRVASAAGTVEVQYRGEQQSLAPGSVFTLADGDVKIWEANGDQLSAERWMQPLMTLSGHGNPELTRRVDALLAQVGRTKLSHLYEQDIRSLGEYGALPLLKFVTAAESHPEPAKRQLAMRILADVAPIWMIPDFLELLEDADPEVRVYSATGLKRLTGVDTGFPIESWRNEKENWQDNLTFWQQWWNKNRLKCPARPVTAFEMTRSEE